MPTVLRSKAHEVADQYFQGRDVKDFPTIGEGLVTLASPGVTFSSPFQGEGSIEVIAGSGSGRGSFTLRSSSAVSEYPSTTFNIPIEHLDEVVVLPHNELKGSSASDGMFHIVMIPTAATGASAATRKHPEIIHFRWPNREYDEDLRVPAERQPSKNNGATYLDVLRAAFDEQLASCDKELIVFGNNAQGKGFGFTTSAELTPVTNSLITEHLKGSLFFLSTGILWLSNRIIYLPFDAIGSTILLFVRDLASRGSRTTNPIVAMGLVVEVSEPFYQGDGNGGSKRLLHFRNVEDFQRVSDTIETYCKAHGLKFVKLEQSFFDYAKGEPMTGWGPLM